MLLNTGEMVSASLLSIALSGRSCPAVGLCGYQAGIRTDQAFSNAAIQEIETGRMRSEVALGRVVVVAGFQGQTVAGELTTLGRGGSDTSAIALAASLGAARCEILKDLPAVYSADPRIVANARAISNLSYQQALDMTFWGAKVLQYRSVEVAEHFRVPIYVGPANGSAQGTLITEDSMLEDSELLSLNSHETVVQLRMTSPSLNEALRSLRLELESRKIAFPQILHSTLTNGFVELNLTGPEEAISPIRELPKQVFLGDSTEQLCSVTATCRGLTRANTIEDVMRKLEHHGIRVANILISAMSITVFIEKSFRMRALELLHSLVPLSFEQSRVASGERGQVVSLHG